MKYKHLFFDMDLTITPARQPISMEMSELLTSLPQTITIVSGQEVSKINWQTNDLESFTLGQNGNHATDLSNQELWNFKLEERQKEEIHNHIKKVQKEFNYYPDIKWCPVEDRGAQITFSPVGCLAPHDVKAVFDPNQKIRQRIMTEIPFVSDDLIVKIGGSTSFDYFHKDKHKGTNIKKLIDYHDWNPDECLFFGDGLFRGGNDEAVIGIIETISVKNETETFEKLKLMFS